MKRSAVISACQQYRYELSRQWGDNDNYVLFVGLNPSTADGEIEDSTMRRCIDFAKSWGFDGLKMANLFAYRETEPKVMKLASQPIGNENDGTLMKLANNATLIVFCWGNHGSHMGRDKIVSDMLACHAGKIKCFGKNKSGQPSHPLYLPKSTELE